MENQAIDVGDKFIHLKAVIPVLGWKFQGDVSVRNTPDEFEANGRSYTKRCETSWEYRRFKPASEETDAEGCVKCRRIVLNQNMWELHREIMEFLYKNDLIIRDKTFP